MKELDSPAKAKAMPRPALAVRILVGLASPRWMLAFFVFALLGALTSIYRPQWITAAWIPPLSLFAVSLLAAIMTNPRFRRDWALLGLHLGLLFFVLLVAVSRLTYFDGAVTLTQGAIFEGNLNVDRRGPLHGNGLAGLRFANAGFAEVYVPGQRWKNTHARVRWWDNKGQVHEVEISNDRPLVLDGYRLYSTFNRGYSPVFRWQAKGGGDELGTVQLRPGEGFNLGTEWQLPDGPVLWVLLETSAARELAPGERRQNLGESGLPHRLVLRLGERRVELVPGETVGLPEGRLTYVRLDSWMGYRLVYDLSMHWMTSAALIVVACMLVFYLRLLRRPV